MSINRIFSRMSITTRLLSWSLVLMIIFYSITLYFFFGIRDLVSNTDQIVNKDLEVVAITEKLVNTTLLFVENRRKYQILGKEMYHTASLHHLNSLEMLMEDLPRDFSFAGINPEVQGLVLNQENPDHSQVQNLSLPSEEALSSWIQDITNLRASYLENINERMHEMYSRGIQAQTFGFLGLGLATLLAVSGSLAIAFFLNRTMREFSRGISRLARNEDFQPVRVSSQGELGRLGGAFNRMGLKLKREEELRSQFISTLSHEIRTPLTSIRESINLVREGVARDNSREQSRFLDIASKETLRLSELLQRLMQSSTLESTSIQLEPVKIDVDKLLKEAVERMYPTAKAGNIRIKVNDSGDHRFAMADIGHVQQVLFNLLGNAVKFSSSGTEVVLSYTSGTDKDKLRICVADQGPGVFEEEKELLFERYYSGKNAENITDGAGLGLSISRQIIRAHGCDLWLEKTSYAGSMFCFTLPLAE